MEQKEVARPHVFVREATGLVRTGTPWRMFGFNLAYLGVTFGFMGLAFTPAFFPGANLELGVLVVGVATVLYCLLYALFSAVMPRSGGDYVVMSRTLHPAIGFALNFQWVLLLGFYFAWGAYWFSWQGASGFFTVLGSITNNAALIQFGSGLAQRDLAFIVGTILTIAFHALIYSGMRRYYVFQSIIVVVGLIGLVLALGLMLFAGHQTFVTNFNNYLQSVAGVQDGYQIVISRAEAAGLPAQPGFSLLATLGIIAILMTPAVGSNWMSGEVKDVKRTQIIGMVGSVVFAYVVYFLFTLGIRFTVGSHFNAAANYLNLVAPEQNLMTVPPHIPVYVDLLTTSLPILVFLGIVWFLWGFSWLPTNIVAVSRMMLAWAFDRIAPDRVADVDKRFHSPVVAIVISAAISELFLVLYAYSGFFLALTPMLAVSIYRAISGLTGILVPFRPNSKRIYEASGVTYKIGRVPLISVLGGVSLIYWLGVLYYVLRHPALGAGTVVGFIFAAAPWALGLIWYYVARVYRKRQGINMDLAFQQIPPE